MILILLSWLYVLFTSLSFGIAFSKVLRIGQLTLVTASILGLFSVTVLATVWAFFGAINIAFHSVFLVVSLFLWFKNKIEFNQVLQDAKSQIHRYSYPVKVLLIISCLFIWAQSATLPFIIDNESYYIQTIKWLNEYGFVKGLANLHLFLGQTSGWHITQSVYSFSFVCDRFNDLNGYCLLLGNLFAFQKLNSYFIRGNRMDLIFGLLPLTYVFLFQFVSSPSPDLPIYVFSFLLFSEYLQNESTSENFSIISILAFYAVFIKITAVVLLLFPLILLLKNFKAVSKQLTSISLVGTLVLVLFVSKNTMLTGYPLFPLLCFRIDALDYTVPSIIMDFFFSKSMLHSFYVPHGYFESWSTLEIVKTYFLKNGMTGYIGIASLLMLLIIPFILIKRSLPSKVWTLYFAFILLALLLGFSSPQYRFYVHFSLFFMLALVSLWVSNTKWILRLYYLSFVLIGFLVFVPISFSNLTDNKLLGQNSTFNFRNIIIPEPNSKWNPEYRGGSVGNMHFHSPIDTSFFWVTANGELPCINTTQLDYFQKGFFYIPQQRSIQLSDGFYSQKVSENE